MNNVRLPIETTRNGNEITKICVEDVYKMVNRITNAMDKAYNDSMEIINKLDNAYYNKSNQTLYYGKDSALIVGTGKSRPCLTDAFDEEIGNDIAFMKAKLNANIKKYRFLIKIWNNYFDVINSITLELDNIGEHISDDLYRLRQYNPEYLLGIENEFGFFKNYEI